MATDPPTSRGSGAAPARLIIADDHDLARAGLRSMLAGERGLDIIGEAINGREAVSLCRRLQPDLVLMDVRMPEMDGLAATRAIKSECPGVSVIIVTMHENPDYLFEALKAGAAGYVLKDATQREVIGAVRQVLRGESLLNAEVATRLLRRLAEETARPQERPAAMLTPREIEVLRLLAHGLTNREIAARLVVSVGTVKVHVERILAKLGVSDRTQAAVRAVKLGLATPTSN
jgi:DNA-binding NarL/FixJ family response regulator